MTDGDGVMLQALFNTARNGSGREMTVTFDAGRICWETEESSVEGAVGHKPDSQRKDLGAIKGNVLIDDVLLAELDDVQDGEDNPTTVSFTIHYASHIHEKKEPRICTSNVRFFGTKENSKEWVDSIQNALSTKFPHRPKRLLAFINPISGKRNGVKIFEEKARPLLDKFITETDVIVTEKSGHIEEILESKDLEEYDGILSVGGDGTLAEVVNGLVRRSTPDLGLDENCEISLSPSPHPIGILPTGSGNIILHNANASRDVVTATLCIILGETLGKDVASVHSGKKLIRYTNLSTAVGFFVDWSRRAERSRWMGMGRLLWGGVYSLAKHSSIEVEIEYLPVDSSQSSERATEAEASSSSSELSNGWRKVSGQFVQCDSYVIDPAGHPVRKTYANGQMCLILVKPCSRTAHVKFLAKFFKQDSQAYDFEFVENIKVKAYKLQPIGNWKNNEGNHYLNVDGDIVCLPEASYSVRIHPELVRLFARKSEVFESKDAGPAQQLSSEN
ncbi:ceramide kinase-like [Liolophura sinensis]|uniref:ceramide kinase-like n=1 Tax=Liolophura sinensis TaxID=3198878 RepID=UPI00315832A3